MEEERSNAPGFFFVIDGTDGAGKRTQTERLVTLLRERGYDAERIDFPRYGSRSAALVEDYLNGKFGTIEEVTPHQASIFYACDRYAFAPELRAKLAKGTIVISDRYVSASMGHQTAKITDQKEREVFIEWLLHLEFKIFAIPEPDKTILLYMPPDVGHRLVEQKGLRDYIVGGGKRDIHEADMQHLRNAAAAYRWVAKREGWSTIECVRDDELRSINDIADEIFELVRSYLPPRAPMVGERTVLGD